jgi:seryl-tRNA synthetase
MLDQKYVVEHLDEVAARLSTRGGRVDLEPLKDLAARRRVAVTTRDQARADQKLLSDGFRQPGVTPERREELRAESKAIGERITALEVEVTDLETRLQDVLLNLPNLPHPTTPVGASADDNVEVRAWGTPRTLDFPAKEHWEIGESLGILDFEGARKISGARFVVYRGIGARLERALAGFMLDMHVARHGYTEILPPVLVNRDCMVGTGQLPKFVEEAYIATDDRT